jgi:hypothetical protein
MKTELYESIERNWTKFTLTEGSSEYEKALKTFVSYLEKRYDAYYKKEVPSLYKQGYSDVPTLKRGQAWDKVIMIRKGQSGGSMHCFINTETGDIYKPASYKAPAKGVRASIFDPKTYQHADPNGGWLYR